MKAGSKFRVVKSGCIFIDKREQVLDAPQKTAVVDIVEGEYFDLFADLEVEGKSFEGLKVTVSGDVIPQELVVLDSCSAESNGAIFSDKPKARPYWFDFRIADVKVDKNVQVKVKCHGSPGGFFITKHGSGEIKLAIGSRNIGDCQTVNFKRKVVLRPRDRPRFQ